MSEFRDFGRSFCRGLSCCGIGAGIGLVVFFAAYLWVFAVRGPLTAMHWFSPAFSITAVAMSFVFVTTAGLIGRQAASVWRVVIYSCLASFVAAILGPSTSMGWWQRKSRLLENPLFQMENVWFIFAANVLAIALGFAFASTRVETTQTPCDVEKLPQ